VSGATVTFKNGTVLSIGSQLTMSGGVASFGTNAVKPKTMTMSGGTYAGTGALTISGLLTWSGGSLCTTQSAGTCTAPTKNAIANANGGVVLSGSPALNGRTLNTTFASVTSGWSVSYTTTSVVATFTAAAQELSREVLQIFWRDRGVEPEYLRRLA
jgi:hypothetical protein